MVPLSFPLQFVLVAFAGWVNHQQREVIDYLQEENRVLREQLGPRRLRFTDDQRRRLAAKARTLGPALSPSSPSGSARSGPRPPLPGQRHHGPATGRVLRRRTQPRASAFGVSRTDA